MCSSDLLRPRWGGSSELMMAAGRRCAQVDEKLYQTVIPMTLLWAVQDIATELPYRQRRAFLRQAFPEVQAMLDRKCAVAQRASEWCEINHFMAILAKHQFLCGYYDEAKATLAKVGGNDGGFDVLGCGGRSYFAAKKDEMLQFINLFAGPLEKQLKQADELENHGKTTEAAQIYLQCLKQTKEEKSRTLLEATAIRLFLSDHKCIPSDDRGIFLLARCGSIDGVKAFLDAGFDINARGIDQCTLLQRSLYPDFDLQDSDDYAGMKIAMLQFLLSRNADFHALAGPQWTMLHLTISNKLPIEVVAFVLSRPGVNINAGDCDKETPLMWCAMLDLEKQARFLLEKGADPNCRDKSGHTALDHAKSDELRNLLLAHGAKPGGQ